MPATEMSTALKVATLISIRCGKVDNKTVRCPGQVCGVCGVIGYSAEICAIAVTGFACEDDVCVSNDGGILSSEKREAFVCDTPGKFLEESDQGGW